MKKTLPLFSANLLYGVTMLLVITAGSFIQSVNLTWGLVATEVLLIGLPTLLFLRQGHVSFKTGLRLNPVTPLTGVLCVILGIAMYLFALLIEGVMAQLTGMQSVSIPNNLLPRTGVDMVVYFLGLAIFAPLCEEILFRGAIQTSYEARKSVRFAITIAALMFAFYHFRLSGLPGLLPIAFVLGYVAWRTNSIWAAMLIHFGNNGMSAVQNIVYFTTGKGLPFISLWSALAGLVVAIVILVLIKRLNPVPVAEVASAAAPTESQVAAAQPSRKPWLATYWPLVIAGALYVGVAVFTLAASMPTRFMSAESAVFGRPNLSSPVVTRYTVANQGGEPVGEMTCTLAPQSGGVRLDCTRSIRAYEYRKGNSYYKDGNHEDTLSAEWDATTMALRSFSFDRKGEEGSRFTSTVRDNQVVSDDSSGRETLSLAQHSLVEFEWAWHAALLKADAGQSFSIPFARLMMWDESKKKSAPVLKTEVLSVGRDETLALPQGNLPARTLTLAGCTAWYARDDAQAGLPRPAKFDDGVLVYTITEG